LGPAAAPCSGLAYWVLLWTVAVLTWGASASLQAGASLTRRDAEQQLRVIGEEFQAALRSYANLRRGDLPSPAARGPKTLDELLRDPRVPGVRRHLRKLYHDPLTGQASWGLVRDRDGYIVGIYSLATGRPIRQLGPAPDLALTGAPASYQDWVFGLQESFQPAQRMGR
jgi:hypothetical protein